MPSRTALPYYSRLLGEEPCLAVVLGDFGRDAGIDFCQRFADCERELITSKLGSGLDFFDEYRLSILHLVCGLRLIKKGILESYAKARTPLDNRILVGFADGLTIEDVADQCASLVLGAIAAPLQRGVRRIMVLNPCNTMTPVSWRLESLFKDEHALRELTCRLPTTVANPEEVIDRLLHQADIRAPTVPEAVFAKISQERASARVLPLGNRNVPGVYEEWAKRTGMNHRVVFPSESENERLSQAICAAFGAQAEEEARARRSLETIIAEMRAEYGDDLVVIEACTDFNYGLGWSSRDIYASYVVDRVYGP